MPIGFAVHERPRPDRELLELLAGIPTPLLSDNMSRMAGAGAEIRPMHGSAPLLGFALTVRTRPGDNLLIHKAIDLAGPGDVIVVDAGGDLSNAVIGEIMATLAAARGASGFVIDGAVRDSDAIAAAGFPIFARGVNHRGPWKDGPGEINAPVVIGQQPVAPGDIVVGDCDGVLAIQPGEVREAARLARLQMDAEAATLAAIRAGTLDRSWVDKQLAARGLGAMIDKPKQDY
jgi:regulator of RNase E activity RraA